MKTFVAAAFAFSLAIFFSSCASQETDSTPPHEKISSMPHNMPASWEGQAGMGAAFNQEQEY